MIWVPILICLNLRYLTFEFEEDTFGKQKSMEKACFHHEFTLFSLRDINSQLRVIVKIV